MENHLHHQTKVLSMNISCCERCPYVLKKKLLKMTGVDSVAIHAERNLVYVGGDIEDTTLLDKVAKLGKAVKLLPDDTQAWNQHRPTKNTAPRKGKSHKNCCCKDGCHNSQKRVDEKEEHKCEDYVPPSINPRICRDFYCKTHPRSRDITDEVTAESSTFFGMGCMAFHGSYGPFGGGSPWYPGWRGQEQHQFRYGGPPRYLPPRPFSFQ